MVILHTIHCLFCVDENEDSHSFHFPIQQHSYMMMSMTGMAHRHPLFFFWIPAVIFLLV